MRSYQQWFLVALGAASLITLGCKANTLGKPSQSASQPAAAYATTLPALMVPGHDPKGTTAAYHKKLKGISKIAQPVEFFTPQADAILEHVQIFPANSPLNEDITNRPVHPDSAKMIASMNRRNVLGWNRDMNYVIVPPNQKKVNVKLTAYPDESDPGPYPVPDIAPVEGWSPEGDVTLDTHQRQTGGDRHMVVLDPMAGLLYEFFTAHKTDQGWEAGAEATFDLKTNAWRPDSWTSSDAAGLPVMPLTVQYIDIKKGIVEHAIRVTVSRTRNSYVYPASHRASNSGNPAFPRMGERFRMKPDVDISGFSPEVQAICKGMKKYGLINADNGQDWLISISPDPRIKNLDDLLKIKPTDFEVIIGTGPDEGPRAKKK